MKTQTAQRKLSLHKETVRHLSDEALEHVAGGNNDSAGVICLFSILGVCGDSVVCSVLAGSCTNTGGDTGGAGGATGPGTGNGRR